MNDDGWYIAIQQPNGDYALIAGPYDTREAADADADRVKDITYDRKPETWFDRWGTGRFTTREPGWLNKAHLI